LATVMNRSPYRVSVKNSPELSCEFPYDQLNLAKAYADNELKEYKAVVSQGACRVLVRIRQKGHKDQNFFVSSYAEANDAISRIESERRHGLFVDYTAALTVGFGKLLSLLCQFWQSKHNSAITSPKNGRIAHNDGRVDFRTEAYDPPKRSRRND
jgi:hypothetical protein